MSNLAIFLVLVFCAVFLLAYLVVVPTFGTDRKLRGQLNRQIESIKSLYNTKHTVSLTRKKYLQTLNTFERSLEALPPVKKLAKVIEQCGYEIHAHRVATMCLMLGIAVALPITLFTGYFIFGCLAGLAIASLPIIFLVGKRNSRMDKFEEQLPEALDVIVRALKAGYPFSQTLKLVSNEMDEPIAGEFYLASAELNYGYDARIALLNLLDRMPSMNMMAVVTSVSIQNETGGNLAEVLTNISAVIRGRFRLRRKVKTLSAEGRLSAWVLVLIPFVLIAALQLSNPTYFPMIFEDPMGKKIIIFTLIMMFLGILWIRKIIRIDV